MVDLSNLHTVALYAGVGTAGALVKELLADHGVVILPKKKGSRLDLGIISGLLIGAAAALVIDNSPELAFFSGMSGPLVLEGMYSQYTKGRQNDKEEGS